MARIERLISGTVIACGGRPGPAVRRDVAAAAAGGGRRVVFAGGDPLLRRDLAELAACARSRGLKVGLATSARLLLGPDGRAALRASGADCVIVAPLDPDAAGHEALTRTKGAFVQTLAAVRALVERWGLLVELRLPVRAGFDLPAGQLLGLLPRGGLYLALHYDPSLPPDLSAAAVCPALAACDRAGVPAGCEGLPPCLLGLYEDRGLDPSRLSGAAGACLGLLRPKDFAQVLLCSECARAASCRGVPRRAVARFSFDAVRPVKEVRSNSFDYTFDRELRGFRPSRKACRGDALLQGCPPPRAVYLQRDGKVSRYLADTNSFTDAELRDVKSVREQLYLDVSGKAMLDDYQKDVRQLAMQEVCQGCPKKERCGVCYGVQEGVPFEREERWLRQEIRRLVGRVLDIGCGDLRFYRETAADLLERGKIEYHGLDVDRKALAELRRRHPQARVHESPIEDFSFRHGYFDYVFALRSLNHFHDLERAFTVMTDLLKDRGMLVMAECVPFGLLRSRAQTRRARRAAGPGFEHYRNWSSEQVLEFIRKKGFPLKLNTHRPVRPGTSNQWLLKFVKISDA